MKIRLAIFLAALLGLCGCGGSSRGSNAVPAVRHHAVVEVAVVEREGRCFHAWGRLPDATACRVRREEMLRASEVRFRPSAQLAVAVVEVEIPVAAIDELLTSGRRLDRLDFGLVVDDELLALQYQGNSGGISVATFMLNVGNPRKVPSWATRAPEPATTDQIGALACQEVAREHRLTVMATSLDRMAERFITFEELSGDWVAECDLGGACSASACTSAFKVFVDSFGATQRDPLAGIDRRDDTMPTQPSS